MFRNYKLIKNTLSNAFHTSFVHTHLYVQCSQLNDNDTILYSGVYNTKARARSIIRCYYNYRNFI